MTDEATKKANGRLLNLAAASFLAGAVGARVHHEMKEPEYIEYLPPPPHAAPNNPKQPGPHEWPHRHHEDEEGPRLRFKTPLDTVDGVKWVGKKTEDKAIS